jgi:hypothetical protein
MSIVIAVDIPKSVSALVDDPFRSLAGELRRVGGFAKDTTPEAERGDKGRTNCQGVVRARHADSK